MDQRRAVASNLKFWSTGGGSLSSNFGSCRSWYKYRHALDENLGQTKASVATALIPRLTSAELAAKTIRRGHRAGLNPVGRAPMFLVKVNGKLLPDHLSLRGHCSFEEVMLDFLR
jgi:hypothetical protein